MKLIKKILIMLIAMIAFCVSVLTEKANAETMNFRYSCTYQNFTTIVETQLSFSGTSRISNGQMQIDIGHINSYYSGSPNNCNVARSDLLDLDTYSCVHEIRGRPNPDEESVNVQLRGPGTFHYNFAISCREEL